MGIAYHTSYAPDGTALNLFDRVVLGTVTAVYGAGASTGASSTVAVTWTEPVPTPYCALVTPREDSTYFIANPTALGFTLSMAPRLATVALVGGSVKVLLVS